MKKIIILMTVTVFFTNLFGISFSQGLFKVFIVRSDDGNGIFGKPQYDGIMEALRREGIKSETNLQTESFYLETRMGTGSVSFPEFHAKAKAAIERIQIFNPDVLVTVDHDAFKFVGLPLSEKGRQTVFSGLDCRSEPYILQKQFMNSRSLPGYTVTGVCRKLHIDGILRAHCKLFPFPKEIRFFLDASPIGKSLLDQVSLEVKGSKSLVEISIVVVKNLEEYRSEIESANENPRISAIFPIVLLLQDSSGKTYGVSEIIKETTALSKKPELALNHEFARLGLFGGAAVDYFGMGLMAGQKTARILTGKNPGDIPVDDAERYSLIFNLKRASQLGIHIPEEFLIAADEIIPE